jgi:hypothetical protein
LNWQKTDAEPQEIFKSLTDGRSVSAHQRAEPERVYDAQASFLNLNFGEDLNMKSLMFFLALTFVLFVTNGMAQKITPETGTPVEFAQYTSYFVSNKVAMTDSRAFIAANDQAQFDKNFGAAASMGKNNFMPKDVWTDHFVAASVKEGGMRKFSNVKVTQQGGSLYVWYDATDNAQGSATYRVPLILAVKRGKYEKIVFMENGKQAGTAELKD